jgi:hypothetical protein
MDSLFKSNLLYSNIRKYGKTVCNFPTSIQGFFHTLQYLPNMNSFGVYPLQNSKTFGNVPTSIDDTH